MNYKLYILAFIEGFLVMAYELIVARLTAPNYGGSLFVLTSILGITMISILIGYYLGGKVVKSGRSVYSPSIDPLVGAKLTPF